MRHIMRQQYAKHWATTVSDIDTAKVIFRRKISPGFESTNDQQNLITRSVKSSNKVISHTQEILYLQDGPNFCPFHGTSHSN